MAATTGKLTAVQGSGRPAETPFGRRRRELWWALGLCAAAAAALGAGLALLGGEGPATVARRTSTATSGTVAEAVTATATVKPTEEASLAFASSGTLAKLYVREGQTVAKGQLLAELENERQRAALAAAQARLAAAEAALRRARQEGDPPAAAEDGGRAGRGRTRTRSPAGRGESRATAAAGQAAPSRSQSVGGAAGSALAGAERERAEAQAAVEEAARALAETRLYAPFAGTVLAVNGTVGETVAPGASRRSEASGEAGGGPTRTGSSGGQPTGLIVIANLSRFELTASVGQSELARLKPGQSATATFEGLGGKKAAATVASLGYLPTGSSSAVLYPVVLALAEPPAGLRPGMTATVEVLVGQESGVVVPAGALRGDTVTVLREGRAETRPAVRGIEGNGEVVIKAGLLSGETVELQTVSATASAGGTLTAPLGRGGGFGGGFGRLFGGGGLP